MISSTELRLNEWLSPLEAHVMSMQSLLIWENPAYSTFFVIFLHMIFW